MAKKKYDDLSKAELVRLLESRDRRDATRFGLVWEADEIERDKALNQDFVALDLIPDLCCPPSPSPGTPGEGRGEGASRERKGKSQSWKNLIIEGDNFDALRYLRMTFAGRVKCIYIDPPYNTGNKDFVYNDNFVDKEDLWRHSKWCEFMFQRLTLAKDLLTRDGLIFISIDDNEMPSLCLLMKRLFGEDNFIANFIWKRRTAADSRNLNGVSGDHEYVICYKTTNSARLLGESKDMTKYSNPDNDPLGPWMSDNLTGLANATERPNLHYEVVHPETGTRYPPHPSRGWIYGQERMGELITSGRILWPKKTAGRPRLKRFQSDMQSAYMGFSTVLDAPGNVEATKELSRILGPKVFTFPKPVELVEQLLAQATSKGDVVVDFFAGSGTSAHAVHRLNADGGNRRVILVSSTERTEDEPDKNLCRDVCATRVRRVIEGYGDTPGLGGDFAYLRTRRIAPGMLTDIDHEQVWTALQLTHMPTLSPFDGSQPFVVADHDGQRLIYVPHLRARDGRALVRAVKQTPACIVYTWQPELAKKRLRDANNVQIEAVPESLARRFGMRI